MNRDEALRILRERTQLLRGLSYAELLHYLGNAQVDVVVTPGGVTYQIEVVAVWDDVPNSDLRILVSIDDGSLRWATSPLTEDFIKRPEGTNVGE